MQCNTVPCDAEVKSAMGIFREMPYWMVKQCDEGTTEGEQRVNDWLTGLVWKDQERPEYRKEGGRNGRARFIYD